MEDLFSIQRFLADIPRLIPYFTVTLKIVAWAAISGSVLGIIIMLLRVWQIRGIQMFLRGYVSFMRGTPMLVQLLIAFYGLPGLLRAIGIPAARWDKLVFVCIAFSLNEGAFISEIFRSAILSIPVGQLEAAYSIGLTRPQAFYHVLMPQSLRIALPALGSDFIGLFQGSSLAFLLGVVDIMGRAKSLGAASHHALEGYVFVALLFMAVSLLLRSIFFYLDKRLLYGR